VSGSLAFANIIFTTGLVIGNMVLAIKDHSKAGFAPSRNVELAATNNV